MKKLELFFLFIIFSISTTVASAKNILELHGGVSTVGKYSTADKANARESYELMAEIRRALTPNIEIGIGTGYQRHGWLKGFNGYTDGIFRVDVKDTHLYDSIPIYFTAKVLGGKRNGVRPYFKANIGYSINKNLHDSYYYTSRESDGEILDNGWLRKFDVKDGLYASLGVGLNYKGLNLDVAYATNTAKIKNTDYFGDSVTNKTDMHRLMLSVGYSLYFGTDEFPYYVRETLHEPKIAKNQAKILREEEKLARKQAKAENKQRERKSSRYKNYLAKNNDDNSNSHKVLKNEMSTEERSFYNSYEHASRVLDPQSYDYDRETYESLPRFAIHNITVRDYDNLLADRAKFAILDKYTGKELNIIDIRALMSELTIAYMNAGFVSTRIALAPAQNISTGTLELVTHPGKLEEIIVDKGKIKNRMQGYFAFPMKTGDILNLREIDQGVDNLNRLESNNAKISVVAGTQVGYSSLIVDNGTKMPLRFKVGYDNTSSVSEKFRGVMSWDNMLNINDNLMVTYYGKSTKFGNRSTKPVKGDNYGVTYSFPVKNWGISMQMSYAEDKNLYSAMVSQYFISTLTHNYSLTLDRLLYRSGRAKTKMAIGMSYKAEKTFLDDIRLTTQNRDYVIANVGINGMAHMLSGMTTYDLTLYQGLNAFNVNVDSPMYVGLDTIDSYSKTDYKFQFTKMYGQLSYYRPINIGNQKITMRLTGTGQYTGDPLFSSEKFSIGGHGSVSGYSSSVSGDIGYLTKMEISYILPEIGKNNKINAFLYKIRPYVEISHGKVRNNYNDTGDHKGIIATLTGYGAGMRYYGDWVNIDGGIVRGDTDEVLKSDKYRGFISATITF